MKLLRAMPVIPLAIIAAMGYVGISGLPVALAVAAFAVLALLCNPLSILDFLPHRFRCSAAASAAIAVCACVLRLTAASRAGILAAAILIILAAAKRIPDWRQAEWLRQSPDVDRILADVGHNVRNAAEESWITKGRAESRALLHQVAGVEISEAKLEASHMPVYCLGYLHAAKHVKKLEQELADERAERAELSKSYLDALDRERQCKSEIAALSESIRKSERAAEIMRGRVDELSGRIAGLKRQHEDDLAEIERLEGLSAEAPEAWESLEDRNIRLLREHEAGASYGQLAADYGLSKSGVILAVKKAREAC